jgi:hypothetical protein
VEEGLSRAADGVGSWLVWASKNVDTFLTGRRFDKADEAAYNAEIRAQLRFGARWLSIVGVGYTFLSESADRYSKFRDKGHSPIISLGVSTTEAGFIAGADYAGSELGAEVGGAALIETGPGAVVGVVGGAMLGGWAASTVAVAEFDWVNRTFFGVG